MIELCEPIGHAIPHIFNCIFHCISEAGACLYDGGATTLGWIGHMIMESVEVVNAWTQAR